MMTKKTVVAMLLLRLRKRCLEWVVVVIVVEAVEAEATVVAVDLEVQDNTRSIVKY